ncbi:vanadium-dependent haloperoxidase [Sediminibacterium sp.]|uniref:vanadium-dependent haloperoxidase n=1 Tax=Sediminibacterium sp. TaxID=1917865 RepID=UPI002732FC83|nr:vanadium-dependent haloperoxidase [Sediminibacterium sp.]MDP3392244.1 vanadium-dependent haloperoxidase [Sediminibacterium sp.]MDP3566954.1 vanadium-dependent haloperoxidase [Sediminibacterium sp.]
MKGKIKNYILFLGLLITAIISCKSKSNNNYSGAELQNFCVQQLTDVIVYDINNPPVAGRMYAYSNLAFYEALRSMNSGYESLLPKLKGFSSINQTDTSLKIDYPFSAGIAFMKVAEALVFSKDSILKSRSLLIENFSHLETEIQTASIAWGEKVAAVVLERASKDGYKITRGMPKFSVLKETGIWQQTPPDYEEAIEPNWRYIKPMLLDSAAQFKPVRPPAFSMQPNSLYYKEVNELLTMSKTLTEEQKTIARYWDDNPFVSEHKGHLTYANKKTTPVGHWMGITAILANQSKKSEVEVAKTYALTSLAIFDGFISTWEEKFTSKTVRPITVIRENLESEWNPYLQTPPFPEYTSGHSVISAAAATVLSEAYGKNTSFNDTTELKYLGMKRSFPSIKAAANEVSMSRMYGGIHYRAAIENGQKQGEQIGSYYNTVFLPNDTGN